MSFDSSKKYKVTHSTGGVYFHGNLRIDNENPPVVTGDVAAQLDKVKIVYTSVAPDGSTKPDPRPRFNFEEITDAAPAPVAEAGEGGSTESKPASSTPQAPSRRAAPPVS